MNENEIFNGNADDCDTLPAVSDRKSVGICFDRTKKKYKAYVDVFGTRINLGSAFPTFHDAANARSNYLNKIFGSSSFCLDCYDSNGNPLPERYPLPKFLQLHFGLSSSDSVRVPLSCIKPYLDLPPQQRKVFPNFVVHCVKKGTAVPDCGSAADDDRCRRCLTPAAASVIFGLYSFRLARLIFACRYEDIIQQMQDVADSVCC